MFKKFKKTISLFVALMMALTIMPAALAADIEDGNLISDGGFENGGESWLTSASRELYNENPANVYSGNNSVLLKKGSNHTDLKAYPDIAAGKPYIVSYMGKTSAGELNAILNVGGGLDENGTHSVPFRATALEPIPVTLNNSEWKEVFYTFAPTSDVDNAELYMISFATNGIENPVYIDNVYLGELLIGDLELDGTTVNAPRPGHSAVSNTLSATAKNQLGTKGGLYTAAETGSDATYTVSWALAEDYDDVSLNGSTLTIGGSANVSQIKVEATATLTYPGVPVENRTQYRETFTLDVVTNEITNLVTNGSFEDDKTGWVNATEKVTINTNAENVRSGSKSAYLNGAGFNDLKVAIPVSAEKPYIVSYMGKAEKLDQQAILALADCDNLFNEPDSVTLTSSEWTNAFYTFVPTTNLNPELYITTPTWGPFANPIYIDDVYVGELFIDDLKYTGKDWISAQGKGGADVTVPLTVEAYNQLGTTGGLYTGENATYSVAWELAEAYEGASISGENLILAPGTKAGQIKVKATATLAYPGVPEANRTSYREIITINVATPGNLFANGGFEEGTSVWDDSDYRTICSENSDNVYSGSNSAYLIEGASHWDVKQKPDVSAGKPYIVSYMGKAKAANQQTMLTMADCDGQFTALESTSVNLTSDKWEEVFYTFVPASTFKTELYAISWSGITNPIYVDNFYLGELFIDDLEYSGNTSVAVPESGNTTLTLDAIAKNQLGTTGGLYTAEETGENATYSVEWKLAENYDGVSLNGSVLTVSSNATVSEVQVEATATLTYPGVDEANYTQYKETFAIKLIPTLSVSEYLFNGGAASALTLTEGSTIAVTSDFTNNGTNGKDFMLLAALYDSSEKLVVAATDRENIAVGAKASMSAGLVLPSELAAGNYTLKVFAWDNALKPMKTPEVYTITK
ncbi:MAG: carbohydrate binding domain-containing protein [Clostridia bacterium]|nr:carbohydrate binding domain-containing protein [Clostridia bacterium]